MLAPADRTLEPLIALALVRRLRAGREAEFPSGAGFAVPTQIVFVPMLLLLPTPSVPLMVALAVLLRSTYRYRRAGRKRPERILVSVADAWFALAPALVH